MKVARTITVTMIPVSITSGRDLQCSAAQVSSSLEGVL